MNDPWLLGRVAALNAVSDLEAKGVSGGWALAIVMLPVGAPPALAGELLFQVLSGARVSFDRAGVVLVGGHTARGSELAVGFSVFAQVEREAELRWRRAAFQGDEELWLTRPLGTGILLRAAARGQLSGSEREALERHLLTGNRGAAAAVALAIASTDVTGFGLAGHLASMLPSQWQAEVSLKAIPLLPGVERLLRCGIRSHFHRVRKELVTAPEELQADPRWELLFDPQTAGPLLLAVSSNQREELATLLRDRDLGAACWIGRILPRKPEESPIRVAP